MLVLFISLSVSSVLAKELTAQFSCMPPGGHIQIFNLDFSKARTWGDLESQSTVRCGLGRLLLRGEHPDPKTPLAQIKKLPNLMYFIPKWQNEKDVTEQEMLVDAQIPTEKDFLLLAAFVYALGRMDWEDARKKYDGLEKYVQESESVSDLYAFMRAHQNPLPLDRKGLYEISIAKHYCWTAHVDHLSIGVSPQDSWEDIEDRLIRAEGPGRLMILGKKPPAQEVPGKEAFLAALPVDFKTVCPTSESGYVHMSVVSRLLAQGEYDKALSFLLDLKMFKEDAFFKKMRLFLKGRTHSRHP